MRVGYVLGDLNTTGAPSRYFTSLVGQVQRRTDVTPVGFYTSGDSSTFDVEMVKMEGALPEWHRLVPKTSVDLVHLNGLPVVANASALRCSVPVVATVHGVLHWVDGLPDDVRPPRRYRAKFRLADRVSRYTVDRAFAVSDSTKSILHRRAGWPEADVHATYEPIADSFFERPRNEDSDWADRRYILHVSSEAPKKNVRTLVEGYAEYRAGATDPPDLVIAGPGWPDVVGDTVSALGVSGSVSCPGLVSERELVDLYDHADLFVFPSLHETFGLPNVEAMARGTPVLTTDRFGIPEVVGDAAAFLPQPGDAASVAAALTDLVDDATRLAALSAAGRARASRFSWANHVEVLVEQYRHTL
jgi:glycosyltransferase involved in cell wall biosynthesis